MSRGLAAAALGAALALGLAGASGAALGQTLPAPAPGCQVARTFPDVSAPEGVLVVPVIIHYMMLDLESVPPNAGFNAADNHVPEVLEKAHELEALFDAPEPDVAHPRRNVNDVWGDYGVRLALVRTERCDFTWADVGQVPVPRPAPTDLTLFRAVVRRFNTPDFNGLNLYQWPKLGGSVAGYGATPRADGPFPGPGAVWFHVLTLSQRDSKQGARARRLVRVMAHEVGHFFSLTHNCGEPRLPGCESHRVVRTMMNKFYDGTLLSPCKQRKAHQGVAKITAGTPITTEEEITCPAAER